jgi:outer membrane lipoprotein-sorting protein
MAGQLNKWTIVLVGLILIGVIISAGCASKSETYDVRIQVVQKAATGSSDESLNELQKKVESISSIKYDLVKTLSDGTEYTSNVVWVKESKSRCELIYEDEVDGVIFMDSDEKVAYQYNPKTETSRSMDYNLARTMVPTPLAERVKTFIESYEGAGMPSMETETIDGKVCTVLGMKVPGGIAEKKIWIWQDYGLPIREEMTTSGTTTTEMKNIEFGDIPASMFELPSGA